ncbi:MAG: 50S ribosomal protein L5 [Candidatus Dependentiae bacterium]|nr:50S ribosomal protein L5 [Candidatus Dependentiae bacterium]
MKKARLKELYTSSIRSELLKKLELNNIMEVPKIAKIVLNVGVKDAITDSSKVIPAVMSVIDRITGQKSVRTLARKSIAGFKLREGMPIGVMVTLRNENMYEFLDRLINLSLPKVRDFQGVSPKFDGQGNYNLGIKGWDIFPELDYEAGDKVRGLNITIHTTAEQDSHAFELLKSFGMPFRK